MNILRSWREIKVMLKWKFSILSDADFEFVEGEKESMLDRFGSQTPENKARTGIDIYGASKILKNRTS